MTSQVLVDVFINTAYIVVRLLGMNGPCLHLLHHITVTMWLRCLLV